MQLSLLKMTIQWISHTAGRFGSSRSSLQVSICLFAKRTNEVEKTIILYYRNTEFIITIIIQSELHMFSTSLLLASSSLSLYSLSVVSDSLASFSAFCLLRKGEIPGQMNPLTTISGLELMCSAFSTNHLEPNSHIQGIFISTGSRVPGDLIPGKPCNNIDKDLIKTFL